MRSFFAALGTGTYLLITSSLIILSFQSLTAQEYTFLQIKEILLDERPRWGDSILREACFGSLDDLLIGSYPPIHPDTPAFYQSMIGKALLEIQTEQVTEGATIWQIYNHGFVIKTPSGTFGIDIANFFNIKEFLGVADGLDAYFITHEHGDHYYQPLITAMNKINKPVVGPAEFAKSVIKMNAGDTMEIAGLQVTAHDGLHSVPVRQFEITTPEGLRFLHTGDNQTSETLPEVSNIDVMMLNAWINESGAIHWIEGVRIAVNKVAPKVTLPGHMMELNHLSTGNAIPYRDPIASDNGTLASDYCVLAWGERYHYGASDDTQPPNPVKNLEYTFRRDAIQFTWDPPQTAQDGDSASFYRVVMNKFEDFWTKERLFLYEGDVSNLENLAVYAYDDCGNQNDGYEEIADFGNIVTLTLHVVVPDETPPDETIYISGNFNQWDPGFFQSGVNETENDLFMIQKGQKRWEITLLFHVDEHLEYKYTRGSWDTVEKGAGGEELPNRILTVPATNGTHMDTVSRWRDNPAVTIDKQGTPDHFYLSQNTPNPFNSKTKFNYSLPKKMRVRVIIYTVTGIQTAVLLNEIQPAGIHRIDFEGTDYDSGVYLCLFNAGGYVKKRKMIIIK
ncbi:MBL fold metallo-hydrolase [bacterium]|nr:MBL fold metallo-hydrolase [bacterium]